MPQLTNNTPGILTETHETPFSGSIWRRTNLDPMPKIYLLIVWTRFYKINIHKSLEPKILNDKVEVLFDSLIFIE